MYKMVGHAFKTQNRLIKIKTRSNDGYRFGETKIIRSPPNIMFYKETFF